MIVRFSRIPENKRYGFNTPFLDYLGLFHLFLFLAIVIYHLTLFLIDKYSKKSSTKIIIGVIAGLLPITIIHLSTFGIPLYNPIIYPYFLLHAIAGGFIPIVEKNIKVYFENK